VTGYTLDAWNRVTAVDYDSATSSTDQTFTYDAGSNLTAVTDETGSTSRNYDDLNRITSETTGAGTVSYAYDATGQLGLLVSITDPSSRSISYDYTANNQIDSVTDSGTSGTTSYSYDAGGLETSITHANGVAVSKIYDDARQLTSVTNTNASSTVLSSFAYTYTNDGQKNTLTEDTGAVVSYTYNDAGRLTSEGRTGSSSYSASYSVDSEGNRTSQTVGGVTRTFAYDTDDALLSTSVGSTVTNSFSYNANGEQTGRTLGSTSYTLGYDGEGQMVSLTDGTTSKSYEYDALGRRASRTAGGVTTEFVRVGDTNGGQVLQDVQGTTVTASYTFGNGLIGKGSDVNLYDGQGTSRQTTSNTGSVTSSRIFEGFGSVVASVGSSENYGYTATSGYRDDGDAGLTHVGARYYDATVGRFITRDNYIDQKPYTYCEGDPVNSLDPSGHKGAFLSVDSKLAAANMEITNGSANAQSGVTLAAAGVAGATVRTTLATGLIS
jgi:RHS repeat-associated protein